MAKLSTRRTTQAKSAQHKGSVMKVKTDLDGDDEEVELSMQEETWHLLAPNFKTVVTDEEFVELGPR
jgi:hypothetical protein